MVESPSCAFLMWVRPHHDMDIRVKQMGVKTGNFTKLIYSSITQPNRVWLTNLGKEVFKQVLFCLKSHLYSAYSSITAEYCTPA